MPRWRWSSAGTWSGVCTNDGCVPTRVLAKAARFRRDAQQFALGGLEGEPPEVDFARLLQPPRSLSGTRFTKKAVAGVNSKRRACACSSVPAPQAFSTSTRSGSTAGSVCGREVHPLRRRSARRIPFPGSGTPDPQRRLDDEKGTALGSGGGRCGDGVSAGLCLRGLRRAGAVAGRRPAHTGGGGRGGVEGVAEAFGRRGIEVITRIGGVEGIGKRDRDLRLYYGEAAACEPSIRKPSCSR